jgi:putative methionine-R-sulfoxide reductase with GAF domain
VIAPEQDSAQRLRRLESVTDAALSQLESDQLLAVLLERVCSLLDADTAAIMLLDGHAQQLVTTAARGLDDELRTGFRLALGRGFTGRIASQRAPVTVTEVGSADVVSDALRRQGVRSLLGVPMLADGELVGVLHVGTLSPRRFSADDVQLLQLVADRACLASQARLNRLDRSAALALQRGLLPTRLPPVEGVELSARYVSGYDTWVGGDWYDVFALPRQRIGIAVGDVAGHGLPAAVVMGRLRSALRAYALECEEPNDVLTRLDRKIDHFEPGSLATALYVVLPPDRASIAISVAGHPPPVMATPDTPAKLVAAPVDLPLGTGTDPARHSTTVDLPVGAVLVCYTDGLVERRGTGIDDGLNRLLETVRPGPAHDVCARIMEYMDTERATDDVAVLTLRRRPDELSAVLAT